jgi:DNA-binding response OmpR family regulator
MEVLLLEEDLALGRFLEKGLRLEGHDVVLTTDTAGAFESAGRRVPDLAILDLGNLHGELKEQKGRRAIAMLREKAEAMSMLVLVGHGEREAGIRCLDLGADDVLEKPISFRELTARCRALERRRERFADPIVRHGEIRMDRMARKVVFGGRNVDLTSTEFRLLEALVVRQGRCASRPELLREVWKTGSENESSQKTNIVEVYINYLRKKLDKAGLGSIQSAIATVRGKGYRLISNGGGELDTVERARLVGMGKNAFA